MNSFVGESSTLYFLWFALFCANLKISIFYLNKSFFVNKDMEVYVLFRFIENYFFPCFHVKVIFA